MTTKTKPTTTITLAEAARVLGRKGGLAKSAKKTRAVRQNARKARRRPQTEAGR